MSPGRGKRVWALRLAVLAVVTAAAAGIAFVIASANGTTTPESTSRHHVDPTAPVGQFVADWHAHDYPGMYALISPAARARISLTRFTAMYGRAASVATMRGLRPTSPPRREGDAVTVTMSVATRLFGRISQALTVPLVHTPRGMRVGWTRALTFPGLAAGDRLQVHVRAPKTRGRILDRGGQVLAEGPATARTYPQGSAFAVVTGGMKPPEGRQVAQRVKAGWPAKEPYGQDGLEASLNPILGGSPRFLPEAKPVSGERARARRATGNEPRRTSRRRCGCRCSRRPRRRSAAGTAAWSS